MRSKSVLVKKFKITWPPLIFSIFPFWSEFWLQTYLLEVAWGGDKSSKKIFGKCHKMNPSKVPPALDPFGWAWKNHTHSESVPVKKFKITYPPLFFQFFEFWAHFGYIYSLLVCLIRKAWKICWKSFSNFSYFLDYLEFQNDINYCLEASENYLGQLQCQYLQLWPKLRFRDFHYRYVIIPTI